MSLMDIPDFSPTVTPRSIRCPAWNQNLWWASGALFGNQGGSEPLSAVRGPGLGHRASWTPWYKRLQRTMEQRAHIYSSNGKMHRKSAGTSGALTRKRPIWELVAFHLGKLKMYAKYIRGKGGAETKTKTKKSEQTRRKVQLSWLII